MGIIWGFHYIWESKNHTEMKLHFVLKNSNNPTTINCRFRPNPEHDFTCATILFVHREDWNTKQQQVKFKSENKNKDLINATLKKLEVKVLEKWLHDIVSNNHIGKTWLKDIVSDFFGKTKKEELHNYYFVDWVQKFVDESHKRIYKGKIISPLTVKQYKTTLNKLKSFESTENLKIKFEDINLKFHSDFIYYCKTVENLGDNSIGGHIKNIKMWCNNIELDGHKINPQFKNKSFTSLSKKTINPYFTECEVTSIFNHDFEDNKRLANVRDLLIIGIRTGLRISDFTRLAEINIKDNRIRINSTVKTNAAVVIPLHWQVKQILQNNNDKLPRTISQPKFNDYIKEVAEEVGITEIIEGELMSKITKRKETGYFKKCDLVTSHICRRTFATLLYGKLPNKVIMAITTHTTEAQLLNYIKTTNDEFADILEEHWEKENVQEN